MGRLKTKASSNTKDMRKAHKMAESFAVYKTDQFLKNFMNHTGLGLTMYGYYVGVQTVWAEKLEVLKADLVKVQGNDIEMSKIQEKIDELTADIDEPRLGMEEFSLKLKEDLDPQFGAALALAYAMGFIDACEGKTSKAMWEEAQRAKASAEGPKIAMPGDAPPQPNFSEGPPVVDEKLISPNVDRPGKLIDLHGDQIKPSGTLVDAQGKEI